MRRGSGTGVLLLTLVLLLGTASAAQAEDCSQYPGGILDGFAGGIAPSQIKIDRDCTIRNFPGGMSTNFSFEQSQQNPGPWLVIFDNVVHTGQMACNAVADHKIWFVNGSFSGIHESCQNLFIPVEKIDKQNPPGQTTAAVGVPFTYSLTIPVLFDPLTGTVIDELGSANDLHSVTIWDDLNDAGVDLTYLSHVAYWRDTGVPVPHTFTNAGGLLTFEVAPIVPAGDQFVIEITVVLEDTPANAPGTQFVNLARWDFGRLIDGVFYEPLPGENGISPPLTIAAPQLVVTKTGPTTLGLTLNLGQWGTFGIDVQNTGLTDAFDVTLLDRLPDGATGGMCDTTPEILSARVFAADGVTPVPGKGPLVPGTDFSQSYSAAPSCELTLTMLTPAGVIGPSERLVISYRTRLDADTQDGVTLTNVVGATEWFNGDSSNPGRLAFVRTLSDGTVGVLDHEDAHTVSAALFGHFFEKSVANLTTGVSPTATAAPGDTLRYTLRLQATDVQLDDLSFFDDLGELNASAVFVPGSLALVPGSIPPGADTSNTNPGGGTNGAGILDIRNLDVPASSQILIQFDITLDSNLTDGTLVLNQADLISAGVDIADSDDPNVNGQADPSVAGDEDPTQVVIATLPIGPLLKANTQATASVGEPFRYRISVPETPYPFDVYDVEITDDLTASAADLRFVSVSKIAGSQPWTPINTGTATNLVIEDPAIGIDIPAGEQVVVEITVVLEDTPTNVAGLSFSNTASFVYHAINGNQASQRLGDPGSSPPMTVVEPELTLEKSGPATMALGTPETFTLDVQNAGGGPAWNATLTDLLPDTANGGSCDTAPAAISAQVFEADGTTPVSGVLVPGTDYTTSYSGTPGCLFTLTILSAQGAIGTGQRLIVSYQTELDANTQNGATLTNIAGAIQWFSFGASSPDRRSYSEVVTGGTVGVLDHEDAHTVTTALPSYLFEKTVANVTSGVSPATSAAPGDVLRYTLRLGNASAVPLADLAFVDDLGSLNPSPVFEPGTLTLVTVPAGADTSGTDPSGGTNGTGLVDVRNLGLPGVGQIVIEFEITLASPLVDGTLVTNQTQLLLGGAPFAVSDDPNVNGPADPFVAGDEDPTVVVIQLPPVGPLLKANTQATASVGERFRYRISVPETPYPFDIYDVQITDDLTASAADLRFLAVTKITGSQPWTPVNTGTPTNLVIEDTSIGIDIPAGEQAVVEVTVVLEDTATNVAGLAFTNTASFVYHRIDADPASQQPGDPGTSPPMTVVEPELTLEKTGPAQMVPGTPETFTLDVQNAGGGPAWNATLTDLLPDTANGGSCDTAPAAVSAQLFEADGTTPVSGVLVPGTDYTTSYSGAPGCLFTLTILSAQGTVGPGQRLIVSYQTELDAGSQNGAALTNIAGAVEWFSSDASSPDRRSHSEVVTDGTVGVLDHEDAHTLLVGLASFLFEKTVANVTSGADPATTAAPGDRLRYRLRLESLSDIPLLDLSFFDELDRLNNPAAFEPGTLQLITVPAGADTSNTSSTGGAKGTGVVDIRNLSLSGSGATLLIEFEITLSALVAGGTLVTNQSQLLVAGAPFVDSDDPNVNGPADPFVAGDEDPTQVLIQLPAVAPLLKENTQATASVGEAFRYRITVPETPYGFPLYDVQITDDLTASAADLRFLGVSKITGSGPWTPVNSGTPTNLVIEDPSVGIDIPAGEQVVVEITVVLENTPTNVAGLSFSNTASFAYRALDGDPASQLPGAPGSSPPMTVVEPELTLEKTGPAQMTPGTPATFALDVHNAGGGAAWNVTIDDLLPDTPAGGTCDAAPSLVGAQLFLADGVTPVSAPLVAGTDLTVAFSGAPGCMFTVSIVSAAGTIGPDQRLIVSYQTVLDVGSQQGAALTNIAGATGWFSADGSNPATAGDRRSYTRTLTDGTVGVLDHEDAHTVTAFVDMPVLFASKDVALVVDAGTPNAVDPGDVLRYTIRISNSGGVAATGVSLADSVPANTSYVADSTTLNGLPVGQPDGGVSPLAAGIPISSSDLTPPLPGPGAGSISPGETAVVEFDLQVDAGVPGGTVISNQAVVASAELPDLPSDGDGDPATGPEPTVVIVSGGQQLLITKQVTVVGGGAALPGSLLEYVVSVQNVALVPASDVVISDDLAVTPGQLSYVAASATLNGSTTGITVAGSLITADYSGSYGPLAPGASVVLIFQAMLDPGLAAGTTVTNTGVVTWDTPPQTASASVSIDVGGVLGAGALNGRVWHDADFDDVLGAGERVLAGWTVELLRNGAPVTSVLTDASGSYAITGVAPNDASGEQLELRFRAPGAGANTAALGRAVSAFTNGLQQITGIVVASGSNLQDLNLPIDPNGVVYGALSRAPLAGATLTLLSAGGGVPLPSSCLDDPVQQGQVTLGDGHYKFDLNFSDPACPSGGSYLIAIVPPGAGFAAGYSAIIPPISGPSTAPFSVPACPGSVDDALPSPQYCEVQAFERAPSGSEPTSYHVHLVLDASQVPGSSQIFNNHIPLDPVLDGAVAISKTTPSQNVSRGQLVPYEITLTNELSSALPNLSIVDRFPAGFRYIEGSGRIDGIPVEPAQNGQELVWPNVSVGAGSRRTLQLLLAVGAGVSEGKFVNRAQAFDGVSGAPVSGEATATVRVVPDPTFSCTDAIGKVFDDANRNGVQDRGERGLPGVRMVTVRGLAAFTDQHGRYHITCAATPNEARGSNFVLKLDDRTLPSGYRLSTRQTLVQRATEGKALRLNFAASIHRVVALDMADAVFEPGTTEMRLHWRPRLALLIEELEKSPATLRLSYVADVEDAELVERRLRAVQQEIRDAWKSVGSYELAIEPEVFWLRGAPPARPTARVPGSR